MTEALLEEAPVTESEGTAPKKFRVQLDFDPEDFRQINLFVKELNVGSRAELFRNALRVLRWMYLKKRQGCAIIAVTSDKTFIEPDFEFFREDLGPSVARPRDEKIAAIETEGGPFMERTRA